MNENKLREEIETLKKENRELELELEMMRYKEKIKFIQKKLDLEYASISLKNYKNNNHFSLIYNLYQQTVVDELLKTGTKFEDIVYAVRKVAEKKYKEELKELESELK